MSILDAFARSLISPALLAAVFVLPLLFVVMRLLRMKQKYRAEASEPFTQPTETR